MAADIRAGGGNGGGAVAAEHPVATEAAKGNPALAAFIEECKRGGVRAVLSLSRMSEIAGSGW